METSGMQCVLAVDGGNSKTIALVAAPDGTVLGMGRGGCGDIYNAVPEGGEGEPSQAALLNVERTLMDALHAAQIAPTDLAVSVFNMAGADWPEDVAFWHEAMSARGVGREIIVQNDALGVLHVASPNATGVS